MFVWSFITVTNGLEKHQPEMFAATASAGSRSRTIRQNLLKVLAEGISGRKRVSIDYALMEKAQNVIVATTGAFWSGTTLAPGTRWRGISSPTRKAIAPWGISSTWTPRGTSSSTSRGQKTGCTPIAVVGLRDSDSVVQTDDAVLLAHKSQAQKIKELVKKLGEDVRLKKLV